jgi:hypothetical protein
MFLESVPRPVHPGRPTAGREVGVGAAGAAALPALGRRLELRELYRAGLPESYIAVADDRALPAGTWHPGMSSRLGPCKIVHMAGSHEVMFTRPAELARTLIEAAYD